jgi:phosphoribosylformylglycinamidine synthase subunit PurQ / glutaminase
MRRNRRDITEERVATARLLRRQMTPSEEVLWRALRDRRLAELKFRRQHVIGPYVVDFCSARARLIVELDGPIHDSIEHAIYDGARTEYLSALGYRVIRFRNDDLINDLPQVLDRILDESQWYGFALPHLTQP